MESTRVTRRRVLGSLGTAGIVGLAGCSDGGDTGDGNGDTPTPDEDGTTTTPGSVSGTVTIGALNPHSGALAYYGNHTLWSMYAGLQHHGAEASQLPGPDAGTGTYTVEVGDVTYEIAVSDTEGAPTTAQTKASSVDPSPCSVSPSRTS